MESHPRSLQTTSLKSDSAAMGSNGIGSPCLSNFHQFYGSWIIFSYKALQGSGANQMIHGKSNKECSEGSVLVSQQQITAKQI